MRFEKWKDTRSWAVYNDAGELINITLYKRGSIALIRQIMQMEGHTEEEITETLLQSDLANRPTRRLGNRKAVYQVNI